MAHFHGLTFADYCTYSTITRIYYYSRGFISATALCFSCTHIKLFLCLPIFIHACKIFACTHVCYSTVYTIYRWPFVSSVHYKFYLSCLSIKIIWAISSVQLRKLFLQYNLKSCFSSTICICCLSRTVWICFFSSTVFKKAVSLVQFK